MNETESIIFKWEDYRNLDFASFMAPSSQAVYPTLDQFIVRLSALGYFISTDMNGNKCYYLFDDIDEEVLWNNNMQFRKIVLIFYILD